MLARPVVSHETMQISSHSFKHHKIGTALFFKKRDPNSRECFREYEFE